MAVAVAAPFRLAVAAPVFCSGSGGGEGEGEGVPPSKEREGITAAADKSRSGLVTGVKSGVSSAHDRFFLVAVATGAGVDAITDDGAGGAGAAAAVNTGVPLELT